MAVLTPSASVPAVSARARRGAAGVRREYRSAISVGGERLGRPTPLVVADEPVRRRATRQRRRRPRGSAMRYLVAGIVGFSLAAAMLLLPGMDAQATRGVSETPVQSVVTVAAGDNLWSIATETFPEMDPREAMARFRSANGLTSPDLTPGQVLVIPE